MYIALGTYTRCIMREHILVNKFHSKTTYRMTPSARRASSEYSFHPSYHGTLMATLARLIKLLEPFQDENQLRKYKKIFFVCSTMRQQREYDGGITGCGWWWKSEWRLGLSQRPPVGITSKVNILSYILFSHSFTNWNWMTGYIPVGPLKPNRSIARI